MACGARNSGSTSAGDGGHASNSGDSGPAPAGTVPTTLLPGVSGYYLVVNSSNLYLATQTAILKVPIDGGAPVTLATIGTSQSLDGLAASDAAVFWTQIDESMSAVQTDILSVPISGGAVTTLATQPGFAGTIATDATSLYWSGSSTTGSCASPPCSTVSKAPLAGGTSVVLSSDAHTPSAFAFDTANVYWATSDGRVMSAAKGGGSSTLLADFAQTSIQGLGLSGSTLFWAASGGDLYTTPIDGGVSKPIEVGSSSIGAAAVSSDGIYWVTTTYANNGEASVVMRTSLDGASTETLWTFQSDSVSSIAVDSRNVYLLTYMGGLLEMAK
jgi:hypothetical protein